jgi:hypothetical protein
MAWLAMGSGGLLLLILCSFFIGKGCQ